MINNQEMSIILPGRVVEYFPATQTATIQISAEFISNNDGELEQVRKREPLLDVPVQTPSGGGWAITMPIKAGNTCILFFSQIGYDHWLHEDKDTAGLLAGRPKPWLNRMFHEDDGFAIVGLNTIPTAVKSYTMDGSQWRNDDATQNIHLKEDLSIEINSPTKLVINAPEVVVNCDTADIVASTKTTIDCPESEMTGNLKVLGGISAGMNITAAGGIGAGVPVSAVDLLIFSAGAFTGTQATLTGEVTAGSNTLTGHTHTEVDDGGNSVETSTANG